jgi:hypothetical protein
MLKIILVSLGVTAAFATLPSFANDGGPDVIFESLGHESKCKEYGFQPGTDAFKQCLLQLDLYVAPPRIVKSPYVLPPPPSPPFRIPPN